MGIWVKGTPFLLKARERRGRGISLQRTVSTPTTSKAAYSRHKKKGQGVTTVTPGPLGQWNVSGELFVHYTGKWGFEANTWRVSGSVILCGARTTHLRPVDSDDDGLRALFGQTPCMTSTYNRMSSFPFLLLV